MEVKNIIKVGNLKNQEAMLAKMDELATKNGNGIYNCTTNQKATLEKMNELATQSANGIYDCTTNQRAMLEKMDQLVAQSANGTYNSTINDRLTALESKVADIYEAVVTKE